MPTTPPQPFHPALLLVDLQVDFSPPHGALPVSLAPDTIPHILSLLSLPFPLKVFTQDTHPPNHISFAPNHPEPNNIPFTSYTTIIHPNDPSKSMQTRLWPVHCVRGTPGWQFLPGIKEWVESHAQGDKVVIVEKGQDARVEMYSAFEDPFDGSICRGSPSLEDIFRDNGVTDVFVVGLAGDYCIKETVIHCGMKGFRTWVIQEGVASVDEGEVGWGEAKISMERVADGTFVKVVGMEGQEVGWVRTLSNET